VPLWKRIWLIFSVLWIVVASLHVATILAFEEFAPHAKAAWPAFFLVAVPALAYVLAWALAKRRARRSDPD
jgi:hypothetical protein